MEVERRRQDRAPVTNRGRAPVTVRSRVESASSSREGVRSRVESNRKEKPERFVYTIVYMYMYSTCDSTVLVHIVHIIDYTM